MGCKSLAQMPTHRNGPVSSNVSPHKRKTVARPISEQPILKAKILAILLKLANVEGYIDFKKPNISQLLELDQRIDDCLYYLNEEGAIYYEEIGEDGFAPIIMCKITSSTPEHLLRCVEEIANSIRELEVRLQSLLKHDPNKLRDDIAQSERHITEAREQLSKNPILAPLKGPLQDIERHFSSIRKVAANYDDIYRNILMPVQEEGRIGIRATVKWAIIGIVASVILSNYKDIWELVQAIRSAG